MGDPLDKSLPAGRFVAQISEGLPLGLPQQRFARQSQLLLRVSGGVC